MEFRKYSAGDFVIRHKIIEKSQNQTPKKHFDKDISFAYLNESGREIFVRIFEEKLNTTIKYKNIGSVSYRRLIRIECYKLYKHFLSEEPYKPFVSDW